MRLELGNGCGTLCRRGVETGLGGVDGCLRRRDIDGRGGVDRRLGGGVARLRERRPGVGRPGAPKGGGHGLGCPLELRATRRERRLLGVERVSLRGDVGRGLCLGVRELRKPVVHLGEPVVRLRLARVELRLPCRDLGVSVVDLLLCRGELASRQRLLERELLSSRLELSHAVVDLGLGVVELALGVGELRERVLLLLVDLRIGGIADLARAPILAVGANLLDLVVDGVHEPVVSVRVAQQRRGAVDTQVDDREGVDQNVVGKHEEGVVGASRGAERHGLAARVDVHGVEHDACDRVLLALEDRRVVADVHEVVVGGRLRVLVRLAAEGHGVADRGAGVGEVALGDGDLASRLGKTTVDDLGFVDARIREGAHVDLRRTRAHGRVVRLGPASDGLLDPVEGGERVNVILREAEGRLDADVEERLGVEELVRGLAQVDAGGLEPDEHGDAEGADHCDGHEALERPADGPRDADVEHLVRRHARHPTTTRSRRSASGSR